GSIKKRDAGHLDRLVRKAGDVVGTELDCLTTVSERRTLGRLLTILDNDHHPLHSTLNRQRSTFSGRLLSLSCSSDRQSPLSPGPFSFLTPRRRGGGGRWTSLHESTSVCPPLLISSQPHAQILPPTYSALSLCSLHYLFSLCALQTHTHTHTHTSTRPLSGTTHPHKHKNIIYFLHSPHQQHKITFHFSLSSWTPTLSKSLHSVTK